MKKNLKYFIPILLFIIIFTSSRSKNFSVGRNNYQGERIIRASEFLIERANDEKIKSYEEGNIQEMYIFPNDNSNDSFDYRFIGNIPSNYVYFNCKDVNDLDTCELWRIIGVFKVSDEFGNLEYRVKIMKDSSIGTYSWNTNNSNDWNYSSLFNYLNGDDYWYQLVSKTQNMIGVARYPILKLSNESNYNNYKISYNYDQNRDDFIGNVGLIQLIDYIYTYSNDIDSDCFNNINNCSNKDLSWINYENPFWTISSDINTHKVYAVGKGLNSVTEYLDVYPVVYLKYDVVIENGAGTSNAPYIIRALYNSDIQSEYEMLQNDENIGDGENISAPDTLKNSSFIFFLICGTIIFVGLILLLISYFKSKKQRV